MLINKISYNLNKIIFNHIIKKMIIFLKKLIHIKIIYLIKINKKINNHGFNKFLIKDKKYN
jgi:hypothetical protein